MRTMFTAIALACGVSFPAAGFAQEVPPLPQAAGDPPARVGRLAELRGGVALLDQQAGGFTPATLNYPITSGSAVQVGAGGRAELQVEGDRFALPGPAALDIAQLDDARLAATLRQGEVCFSLARVPPGRSYAVQTPRGLVTIAAGGHYAVTAGDTATPTTITVLDGAALASGPGLNLQIGAGQAAALTGAEAPPLAPAAPDQCLTDLLAEERGPPRRAGAPPPPVVQQMTGGEDLAGYGVWQPTPEHGSVWYPRVEPGWVPYRHGHWAFVPPWGWTWCDDAPWGFAPFHYGRWVETGGRWGWAPTEPGAAFRGPPVYAPALVSFFGVGAAALAGGALLAGSVGWVPLGPREPYYPWYHASPAYVRELNVRHVTNISSVVNSYTSNSYGAVGVNRYVNNAGATLVPAAAMARSLPVAGQARPLGPQQLQAAQPVLGRMAAPAASGAAFHVPPPQARSVTGAPVPRIQTPPTGVPPTGVPPTGAPPTGAPPPGITPPHPEPPRTLPGQLPAAVSAPRGVAPPPILHEATPATRPPLAPAPVAPPVREAAPILRPAPAAAPPPPQAAPVFPTARPATVEPPHVAPVRPPVPEPHGAPPPQAAPLFQPPHPAPVEPPHVAPPPPPRAAPPVEHAAPPRPAPAREKRPGEP